MGADSPKASRAHTHIKLFLLCLMALCVDKTGVLLILPTHHVCLFFFTSRCVFVLREFPSAPRFSQFDISRTTVCYCFFLSVFLHSSAALLSNFLATNLTSSRLVSFFNHFFPRTYTRLQTRSVARMQDHKITLHITFQRLPPL